MGELATRYQSYLCNQFSELYPSLDWKTEHRIAGTPVDIAGVGDGILLVIELEWRRADPADNSAKLFRHLSTGQVDQNHVTVIQIFTGYYDLETGGVSSKRKNAEFIGHIAEDAIDALSYYSVDFDPEPPKRGGDWEEDWKASAKETVSAISEKIRT
ncbi:hypothetical protein [Natronorubrum texcoconense]|uniref:hypothetical protein n=1 Tax=Natronorubrum texcoconense TaxID=1095776 RepID=UPI000B8002D7|nr:hypothetical protein [Natronorubrum texcoconense]